MNKHLLLHGDCLNLIPSLALSDRRINVVITSPPYNMNLRIRNGTHCSRQIVKEMSTKYENYPDNLDMDSYYKFNKKVISQLLKVSDHVFYNVQFLTGNKSALYRLMGDFSTHLKEFIVWDKVNAEPAIGEGILNSRWEAILVFSADPADAISRKFKNAQFQRGCMQNLLQIKRGKKIESSHGAVFPTELAEALLVNFTKKGDVVLDPFMGTGTTGIVCADHDREFIGIEKDEKYFKIASDRIAVCLEDKKRIREVLK